MENTENQDVYNQKLKTLHKQYKSLIEFFINKNSLKKLTAKYEKLLSIRDILELKKKEIIDLDKLESVLIQLKDYCEKKNKPSTSMGVINLVDDSDEDDEVQFVGYGKLTEIKNSQNIKEEKKPAANSAEKKKSDKCDIKHNISKTEPGDSVFHILNNELEEMELDHNYFVHPSDDKQSNELHTDTDVQQDSEASLTLCNETDSNDITNSKKSDILNHSGDKNEVNDTTENSSEIKKVKSDHKNENKENVISTKQSDKKSNYPTKEPLDSKENKLQNDMFDQNQLIIKSNQIEFNSNNSDVSNKYKNIFDLIDNSLSDVSDEDLDNNISSEEFLEREQIQLSSSPKEKPMKNKKRKKEKKHKKREKIETDSKKKSIGDTPKNIETNISSVKSKTSLLKSSKLEENCSDEHQNMNETASEWSKIASSYESRNSLSDVHVKTVEKKSEKSGLNDHIDLRNSVLYDDFELEPSIEDYEYLGLEFPNKVKKLALIDKQSSDDDLEKDQQESKQNKVSKTFDDIDDGRLFSKTFGSIQTESKSENNVNKDSPKNQNKSDKSHLSVLDKELPNEVGTELMEERNSLFHRRQSKPEQEQLSQNSEDNINEFLRQLDEAIESDDHKLSVNNSDEKNTLSINKIIYTELQNTEKCNKLVKNEILKSPKQLGVIVIDESSDEDENEVLNKNENFEDNTYSRETSPLTVKIVSRENTPPRVVSPDHLKEIINASEILSQTKNQDVANKCETRNRENHIIQRNDKNENSQNEIHSSSEKNHNCFLKFFNVSEENENETSLSELLRIRQEFEAKIPLSRSQIEKIIGFSNEKTEITDDYESNQIEADQSNETSSNQNFEDVSPNCNRSETNLQNIEINTGILNNVCKAISQIINKNEMHATESQTFNTTSVTPPSSFPIQNNFIPQQSNIYNSNVLNYPRYPTVNPNDPRLRNRLKQLFQKTEKISVQQKTQQHNVPLPPPGPPLTLDQLPVSQSVSQTPKKTEIPKVGTSKFTKKYEQAKQAALARKAEKEKEKKQKEYSETMFEKMSKIPNTESVMDKMYRTGQYFLESSTPIGFKIPKKKTEEESHQINKSEIQSNSINSKPLKNGRRSLLAPEKISDESYGLSDFSVEIDKNQTNPVKPKPIRNRRQSSYTAESISDESKEIKDFDAENNKAVKPKPVRARRRSLFQPKMGNKEIQSNVIKSKTLKNRRKSLSSLNEIFDESDRVKDFNLKIDKTQSNTLKSKPVKNRRRSVASKGKNEMNDFEEEDNKESFDVSDIYFDVSESDEDNINEAIKKSINNKNNNKKNNFNSDDDNDDNKSYKNSSDYSGDNVIKEALQKLKNKLSEDKYLKIENIIKKHEGVESQEFLSSNSTMPTKYPDSKKLKIKTTSTKEVDKLKNDIANSFMAKDLFNINFTRKCSEVARKKMKNIMESTENHNKTVIENENGSNSEDEESECKKLKIRKRRKSMNATFNENNNYVLQDDDGEDTDDYTEDKAKKRKTQCSSTSIKLISEEVRRPTILLKKLKPNDIMALSSCKQLTEENKKETVFDDSDPLLKVIKEVPDNLQICQKKKIANSKNSRIKNKNPEYHINSKYMQFCVLCYAQDISENKIVSHYVDEHPSDEVFVSRLQRTDIDRLKVNQNVAALSQEEIAGSLKYSTECIFCKNIIKVESFVKFNTHYSTHTGEYQYKCSECDIRKWNKKDIKKHCKDECEDARIQTYYSFDKNANIIYIYVCNRCTYVQLHKANIEKHLRTEHGFDRISESDILQLKLTEREPDPAIYEGNGRFEVSHENIRFFNGDELFKENDIRIKNEIIEDITPKMNIGQGSNVMTVVHGINSLSNECSSNTEEEITQNPLNGSQYILDGNEEIEIKPTIVDENNYLYLENFDLNSTSVKEDLQKDIKIENGENVIADENGLVDENPDSMPQIIAAHLNKDEQKSLESSQISVINNLKGKNNSEILTEVQSSKDNVSLCKNKEKLLQVQQHISTQNIDEVICLDDNENKKHNYYNSPTENDETILTTDERRTIDNQIYSEVVNSSKRNVEFDLDATEKAHKFSLIKSLKENPNATEICNFCYETRNDGIYLYCLINECSFTNTMDFKIFESHVESNHGTRMWNGICKACRKNVTNDKHVPISNEINHMIQNHLSIYQKTPPCKSLQLSDNLNNKSVSDTNIVISLRERNNSDKNKQESLVLFSIPATNNLEAENDSETVTELQSSKDSVSLCQTEGKIVQDQQHTSTQNIDEVICLDDNDDNKNNNSPHRPINNDDNKNNNSPHRPINNDVTIFTIHEQKTIDNQILLNTINMTKILDATEIARKFSLIKSLKENPNATEICNFCYETRNDGIYLYCLINECSFTNTMDFKIFESHVESNHGTRMWNGICKACRKNVTNDKHVPMSNEISHMIQNHLSIYQKTPICKSLQISDDDEALESVIITQLLKPWIKNTISKKTRSQCEKMKQIDALSVQYKCMGVNCAFTTNEKSEMINHLEKHIHLNQNELKAHLECCYCDSYFENSIQLVGHINEIHGTSTFQCSKCFYRSIVEFNVLTHLNLFHQNDKDNNQIIECIGKIKNLQYEKAEVLRGRSKNVISLQCKVCSMNFYVKEYLYNHMKNKHNITDKNQLPDIGVFACTYCKFDCKILQDIREHLANEHPSKLLYVCGRGAPNRSFCFNNVEYETSINSTCIVFVGESVPNWLIKRLHINDKNSQDLNNDQNPLPSTSAKEISDDVNLFLEEFDDALVDMEDFIKHMEGPYPQKKPNINNYSCNYSKLKTLIHKLAFNNGSLLGKRLYLCAKYDCKESFETLIEWKIHMTDKHPKSKKNVKFACPHCPRKSWMNINDLAKHFDTHKADIDKFICYFCGDLLSTLELAKMHISNKHSSISVKTIILENRKKESEFNLVVTHDIQFNKSQLLTHMISVMEIKLGINVNENENMDMETYKNNNNANKNILSSTRTSKKNDNDLPIFISIYRRYICNYDSCEIKFEDKCSFEKHIRQLHSSKTIYKCPHCNEEFLINNSKFYEIINHMKLHSRTVYQCSKCSDYIATDKLNKHINEMHNDENLTIIRYLRNEQFVKKLIIVSLAITNKTAISTIGFYICFLCSLNFNDLQSMKNHMLSDHNFALQYHCVHCTTVHEDNENSILKRLICNHLNKEQQRIYISFHKKSTTGLLEDFTCKVLLTLTNDENNKDDCDDDDVIIIDDDCLDNNSSVVNKKRLLTNENTNENQKKLKLTEISTESELFKCTKCKFSTDTKEAMTDHIKYNHHNNDTGEKESNIHLVLPSTSSTNYGQNVNQLYKCDVADCYFLCDDESNLNEHKLINHKRMLLNKPQQEIIQNSSFGNIKITIPNNDCIQVDPPLSNSFSPQIHSTEQNKPQTGLIRVKPMEKLLANPRNTVTSNSEMSTIRCNDSSSGNLLSKSLASTITFKSHGLFPDIAFKCNYCNVAFEDINNLYQHWKQVHAATHQFEYRIDQFLCCLYCNRVSTFENLKNHHSFNHHSDVFVTRLLSNKHKCTECTYKCPANNLAEFKIHFRNDHPDMILRKNISVDFIDDNLLNALLQIDYKVFYYKCKYCEAIFRLEEKCKKHITEYHPTQSLVFVKFLEKRIFYSCRNCRNSIHLNEKQAVEHITKTHIRPFICKICERFQFYSLEYLSHHIRNIHNIQFDMKHYKQEIIDKFTLYKEIIFMFPNGLVLTKHELKNTRYYDAKEFKQLILTTEAKIEKEKAAGI